MDDTWSADIFDMQSFSKYNDGAKYLLNVFDVLSKYACSLPIHDKTDKNHRRGHAFNDTLKPRNLWVDRRGEFYNRTMDSWLKNIIFAGIRPIYNEGKAVVVERFYRTLKTRIWKYFSANNTYIYISTFWINNTTPPTIDLY